MGGGSITKKVLRNGEIRWRVCAEAQRPDGSRKQVVRHKRSLAEAKRWKRGVESDSDRGVRVAGKQTLETYATDWIAGKKLVLRASTVANYRTVLADPVKLLGHKQLSAISRADVAGVMTKMRARGLSVGTVNSARRVLGQLLGDAQLDGFVQTNVVRALKPLRNDARRRDSLDAEQVAAFLAFVAGERDEHVWHLAARGLRRGELVGLRWHHVDFDTKTVSIETNRVLVSTENGAEVLEGAPKSRRSVRTIPLDSGVLEVLRSAKRRQTVERLAAGEAYSALDFVACDSLGNATRPNHVSWRFKGLLRSAGLPTVVLHSLRNSSVSVMLANGIDPVATAEYHGHDVAVMARAYASAQKDRLVGAADTLAAAYRQ